ncbi:MAG: lipopolysaccharide heptosyltransferase II [Desulfuromonadaceae bacterium]|nr:lipopolysaccharide heptosyltransferase II [Desulfuromonadaceae bacterium]
MIKHILIRSVNWIGDAVMTTPAIGVIREFFPQSEITILANPLVSQIFINHCWVDRVIAFDENRTHRGIAGRMKLARELKRHSFDLAIILPNSINAALVPWLAGIPMRLGKMGDGRSLLLTHRFPRSLQALDVHQSQNYLAILEYFGITGSKKSQLLVTTVAEDSAIASRLAGSGINEGDFVLGINPGATYGSAKRWYPDRFAEVARTLAVTWGAKVIITGGPGETAIAADIERDLPGNCLNMAGQTSVRELMALVKRCNFFITNDSGPMHLAAAFAVPLVAVFGSTDHSTTYPLSDNAVMVRESVECSPCMKRECPTDHMCMKSVLPQTVINRALELHRR